MAAVVFIIWIPTEKYEESISTYQVWKTNTNVVQESGNEATTSTRVSFQVTSKWF